MHEEGHSSVDQSIMEGKPLGESLLLKRPNPLMRLAGYCIINANVLFLIAVVPAIILFVTSGVGTEIKKNNEVTSYFEKTEPSAPADTPSSETSASIIQNKEKHSEPSEALLEAVSRLEKTLTTVQSKVEALPDTASIMKTTELSVPLGRDQATGFIRTINEDVDQHFIVVNSLSDDGLPFEVEVVDMDTGAKMRTVSFAVLVPEETYLNVVEEKKSNPDMPFTKAGSYDGKDMDWKMKTYNQYLVDWQEYAE